MNSRPVKPQRLTVADAVASVVWVAVGVTLMIAGDAPMWAWGATLILAAASTSPAYYTTCCRHGRGGDR